MRERKMGTEHQPSSSFSDQRTFQEGNRKQKCKIIKKIERCLLQTLITLVWFFARSTSPNVAPPFDFHWEQWGWALEDFHNF